MTQVMPKPIEQSASPTVIRAVADDQQFTGRIWSGQQLGPVVAFDVETTLIDQTDPTHIPRLVLASASDGEQNVIVCGCDIERFLQQHAHCTFVAHNWPFDYFVVWRHSRAAAAILAAAGDRHRLRNTLMLALCIGMFETGLDSPHGARGQSLSLARLAKQYCGIELNKEDEHRTRYAEILGSDLRNVAPEWLSYALLDAIATWRLYFALQAKARDLLRLWASRIDVSFVERLGYFAEAVNVNGAIALEKIRRTGVTIDALGATPSTRTWRRLRWRRRFKRRGRRQGFSSVTKGPVNFF